MFELHSFFFIYFDKAFLLQKSPEFFITSGERMPDKLA